MTELAAPQISSLMEALPGIAAVLRSPVATAIVALSRAGAGLEDFRLADADELLRYGVRRNLLTQEEVDQVLREVEAAVASRPAKPAKAEAVEPKKAPPPAARKIAPPPPKAAAPAKATAAKAAAPKPKAPAKPKVATRKAAAPARKPAAKAAAKAPARKPPAKKR
jgi:outer membrane biosynthesis protein TonB